MRISTTNIGHDISKAKTLLSAGTPIICFDLETTGLSPIEERILSFSAIKCQYRNGIFVEIERKDIFINPEREISAAVTAINHIDNERVKNCPTEDVAVHEIQRFFGETPFLCGYNSTRFDEPFIKNMYMRTTGDDFKPILPIDVMQMAKEKLESKKYNLQTISHLMGADGNIEFHNSLDDVIATFRVFQMLLREYSDIVEEKPVMKFKVNGANLYRVSHKVNRIYISTYPYSKTYYDIYKKEWHSDTDNFDLEALVSDVFALYKVTNEKELEKAVQMQKKQA